MNALTGSLVNITGRVCPPLLRVGTKTVCGALVGGIALSTLFALSVFLADPFNKYDLDHAKFVIHAIYLSYVPTVGALVGGVARGVDQIAIEIINTFRKPSQISTLQEVKEE